MLISPLSHTLWISQLINPSFPQPRTLIFHHFFFSRAYFAYFSRTFRRNLEFHVAFARFFHMVLQAFENSKQKLILYFCQKQYFPHARVIFHNCLKSVFVDKSRKNPRFQPTFPRFYSHSRVLISPLRVKISRKSHFFRKRAKVSLVFSKSCQKFFPRKPRAFSFLRIFLSPYAIYLYII